MEAIVITASGCGAAIKDYGELLKHDSQYAEQAKQISELARDLSEILANKVLTKIPRENNASIAFHSPCTL